MRRVTDLKALSFILSWLCPPLSF